MTNFNNTVLYIGVTNDLKRRAIEHKTGMNEGFTKKSNCVKLVWFEKFEDIRLAIEQEKRMKKWKREFKENLINNTNPDWNDLYDSL